MLRLNVATAPAPTAARAASVAREDSSAFVEMNLVRQIDVRGVQPFGPATRAGPTDSRSALGGRGFVGPTDRSCLGLAGLTRLPPATVRFSSVPAAFAHDSVRGAISGPEN